MMSRHLEGLFHNAYLHAETNNIYILVNLEYINISHKTINIFFNNSG